MIDRVVERIRPPGTDRARGQSSDGKGGARHGEARQGKEARAIHGLRCLEVRARAGIVLAVVYRVAGSMRSRLGLRQPACGAPKARTPAHYAKADRHIL